MNELDVHVVDGVLDLAVNGCVSESGHLIGRLRPDSPPFDPSNVPLKRLCSGASSPLQCQECRARGWDAGLVWCGINMLCMCRPGQGPKAEVYKNGRSGYRHLDLVQGTNKTNQTRDKMIDSPPP